MDFMAKTLARSRTHRLLWLVYLGAALAVVLNSSIIDEAILVRGGGWNKALRFLVLFWPLACSVVILNGFRHVLSIPAELRANWIFQITESQGRTEGASAVERFVMAYAIAPIYLIVFPVQGYVLGWGMATRLTILQVLISLSIFELLFQSWQKLPFTCSHLPGQNAAGGLGWPVRGFAGRGGAYSLGDDRGCERQLVPLPDLPADFRRPLDLVPQTEPRGMGRGEADLRRLAGNGYRSWD
ncbi:MAG: hypothetical protein WCB12_08090 [Bryobacteraceae bacterium]